MEAKGSPTPTVLVLSFHALLVEVNIYINFLKRNMLLVGAIQNNKVHIFYLVILLLHFNLIETTAFKIQKYL